MYRKQATRADVLDFVNWLADKDGEYDPQSSGNCLVCQYLSARGQRPIFRSTKELCINNLVFELPEPIAVIAYGESGQAGVMLERFENAYNRARIELERFK